MAYLIISSHKMSAISCRCEDLPELKRKDKDTIYQEEDYGYQHEEQNVYQPTYYEGDNIADEYKEPSASVSITVEHNDDASNQDSPSTSTYEVEADLSLPKETVYGSEYSDPKAWYDKYLSKFSNDPNTKPHYHKDNADFTDLQEDKDRGLYSDDSNAVSNGNNDNVYYSRTQERYISYEGDGPVHYYTDSELSYNTDRNYNTYDYVLPDDYGRRTEYNTVEEPVNPVPETYYPDTYQPENEVSVTTYDDFYPQTAETGYDASEYKIDGIPIDGTGFHGDDKTYYSYDGPSLGEDKPVSLDSYVSPIPENWYYRQEAELANHHFPHGWHPYFFPWFYGHHTYNSEAHAKYNEDPSHGKKKTWNGQPYIQEDEKSQEHPPKKSHYEPPKKSHELPKKSHYEPTKKSHLPSKKSHYEPPKKSQPLPKKSYYEPPKKSHPPPKKSHYVPPKKSHPPPKKSHYEPKKSHPAPKKSHYEPPKKSHEPAPKKSHSPPKKITLPKESHEPAPKKSHDPPAKKSYEPAPKKPYVPPQNSHQSPKGKYQPPDKTPSKSVSPKKVFEPEETQPTRDENTVYSLGGNLQVRGNTLIHADDEHQDGVNAYVEV